MPATLPTHDVDPAMNLAEQALYRFTSLALLDPRAGAWEQLDALRGTTLLDDAAELVREDPAACAQQFGRGELPLSDLVPANVLSALPATASEMNRQYEAVFGLLVSGACPPYETEYINGKFAVQRAQTLGDISGFYRAFGLQLSSVRAERHDHVVIQLEFMALLLSLELQAAGDGVSRDDRIAVCREARERFYREHLAWWVPAFAHLLAREAAGGFYGEVARLLAALLTCQRARFGLATPQDDPHPSQLERPEECEGCGLSQA